MDLNQPKNNANALSQNLPGVTIETNLGSGLIDYSHKMTAAAMQIAEK